MHRTAMATYPSLSGSRPIRVSESPTICELERLGPRFGIREDQSDAVNVVVYAPSAWVSGSASTGEVMMASQSSNSSMLYWFFARLHPR